jgi:hypothetical protein
VPRRSSEEAQPTNTTVRSRPTSRPTSSQQNTVIRQSQQMITDQTTYLLTVIQGNLRDRAEEFIVDKLSSQIDQHAASLKKNLIVSEVEIVLEFYLYYISL